MSLKLSNKQLKTHNTMQTTKFKKEVELRTLSSSIRNLSLQ